MKRDAEVYCSYCITAFGFRRMLRNLLGEYVCPACGHVAVAEDPQFHCTCMRCRTMTVNIAYKAPALHR